MNEMKSEPQNAGEKDSIEISRIISEEINRSVEGLKNMVALLESNSEKDSAWFDNSFLADIPAPSEYSSQSSSLSDMISRLASAIAAEAVRRVASSSSPAMLNGVKPQSAPYQSVSGIALGRRGELDSMLLIEDWAGRVVGQTYLEENLRIPRYRRCIYGSGATK